MNRYQAEERKKQIWIISLVAIGILGLATLLFCIFHTTVVPVEIQGHRWRRLIEVERFKAVRYEYELGHAPYNAYDVSEWTESEDVYRTEYDKDGNSRQVFSHTEYTDYCSYTLDQWAHQRWIESTEQNQNPYWPVTDHVNFQPANAPLEIQYKWERLADRDEQYFATVLEVDGKNRHWEEQVTWDEWNKMNMKDIHHANVNHFGSIMSFTLLNQE